MTNEELIELITEIVERHHCDSWTSGRACAEEIVAMLPAFDRKFQPKESSQ